MLGADVAVLQSLVEKSLVQYTFERFWMLETIVSSRGRGSTKSAEAGPNLRRPPRHGSCSPWRGGRAAVRAAPRTDAAAKQLDLEREHNVARRSNGQTGR